MLIEVPSYFRHHMASCMRDIKAWIESTGYPAHGPYLCRSAKADDFMMSQAYNKDVYWINAAMME